MTTLAAVRAVFWRPLSMADPAQLVSISLRMPGESGAGRWGSVHSLVFRFWREQQDAFVDLAAYGTTLSANLLLEGGAEDLQVLQVTGNFFDLLRVPPEAGRMFTQSEVDIDQALGVMSHAAWTRLFARDPGVTGRSLHLDHPWSAVIPDLVTIVGVASPELDADWSADSTPVDIFTVLHDGVAHPNVGSSDGCDRVSHASWPRSGCARWSRERPVRSAPLTFPLSRCPPGRVSPRCTRSSTAMRDRWSGCCSPQADSSS